MLDLTVTATHWEASLHLLQMLPGWPIPRGKTKRLAKRLRENLEADNKFVRAWCYNGLFELARQHGEFRDEVSQLLDQAEQTEAASVKARIRKIRAAK